MSLTAWSLAIVTLFGSPLSAQISADRVVIGTEVRFRLASPDSTSGPTILRECEGKVSRLSLDTIVVRPHGQCGSDILQPRLVELQTEKRRGSRVAHIKKGLIFGAISGGILGRLIVGDGCKRPGCDGGYAVLQYTLTGLVGGGIIGSAIGFALPAGTHWHSIRGRSVRIDYER